MAWKGPLPKKCEICDNTLRDQFVDGATARGWAIMCRACAKLYSYGFGLGKGQLYDAATGQKLER